MKNLYSILCLNLIFILFASNATAQLKRPEKPNPKKSVWKAGLSYLSDNVWLGRKDSVPLPYLTPSIGYYHKSGLYLSGSLSYATGYSENRIDLVTLEGGYSYATDKINLEFSLSKEFYNSESFNVNAEIKGRMDAYFSYDLGFIEPSLQAGLNFATNPDVGIGFGLEHSFQALHEKLEISPAFLVNLGTQNYYASYYNNRRYNPNRRGKQPVMPGPSVEASLSDASTFQLMDYEFSLPVEYTFKKFTFKFTPTYAIPQNPSDVTLVVKQSNGSTHSQTTTETLDNSFYWSCGVIYKF